MGEGSQVGQHRGHLQVQAVGLGCGGGTLRGAGMAASPRSIPPQGPEPIPTNRTSGAASAADALRHFAPTMEVLDPTERLVPPTAVGQPRAGNKPKHPLIHPLPTQDKGCASLESPLGKSPPRPCQGEGQSTVGSQVHPQEPPAPPYPQPIPGPGSGSSGQTAP